MKASPPDVAHFRSHGVAGVRVWCLGCGRHAVLSFEAARAREGDTIARIAARLTCSACGARRPQVMPDWPAMGPGGMPASRG